MVDQYISRYMLEKETMGNYLTYKDFGFKIQRIGVEPLVNAEENNSIKIGVPFMSTGFQELLKVDLRVQDGKLMLIVDPYCENCPKNFDPRKILTLDGSHWD